MALSKSFTLPNGVALSHFRILPGRMDPVSKEASFIIAGYVNASIPQSLPYGDGIFAKLRLSGDKFDQYLSKTALTQAALDGKDLYAILYEAAKVEPCIGDCGASFFHDASDV